MSAGARVQEKTMRFCPKVLTSNGWLPRGAFAAALALSLSGVMFAHQQAPQQQQDQPPVQSQDQVPQPSQQQTQPPNQGQATPAQPQDQQAPPPPAQDSNRPPVTSVDRMPQNSRQNGQANAPQYRARESGPILATESSPQRPQRAVRSGALYAHDSRRNGPYHAP